MKIGIVCYPTYGGSGIVATELGKALADKGHEVHFISYSQPVRLELFSENMFFHEVSVSDYPLFEYTPYELTLTSKLVDVAMHEKLDILHVHYAIPHASAAYSAKQILAARGVHLPFVTTLHGTDITLLGKDESFKPVIEFAINHSDAVTAVSDSLKQDTLESFNIKREIAVIPNFIDYEHYRNRFNQKIKASIAPAGEKIITHVSNFRKVKRIEDVVQVFHAVQQELPAKLLLVGDGPERPRIEQLCRQLSLCDQVKFMGKSKSIEKLMAVSDLFLLPSEAESFGLVALEAMASGVPVVSSNAGGLPEVNVHGKTGFLSEVADVLDMAKNAQAILEGDLEGFKEAAKKHAQTFDLPNILPMYERLYESLL
jgi:N-acetyl-alpha-D-glucosaminyl L-malate synthase BshA